MNFLLPLLLAASLTDFSGDTAGEEPADLLIVDGVFKVVEDGEDKYLEVQGQPIVESVALFGPRLDAGVTVVSARVKADKKRRVAPRFGIGMHGTGGFRLRAVPAAKKLELLKNKEVVATAPLDWKANAWSTIELSMRLDGAVWKVEGRLWEEGSARPEEPAITHAADGEGKGKCSVWATPYAGLPIFIDDLTVRNAAAEAKK